MKTTAPYPLPDALRRKLMFALPGGLALTSPLALVGCGGGGGSGDSSASDTPAARARVELPAGSTLKTAELTLVNALGNAAVDAKGQTDALALASNEPAMALLVDASGRLVLFGYLDPLAAAEANVLGSRSAAQALLFFALGGPQAPVQTRRTMLNLIREEPVTATLAGVLDTRLALSAFALQEGDAQIQAAIQAAVAALTVKHGGNAAGRRGTASTSARARRLAAGGPSKFLIDQTALQSGAEVLQDPAAAEAIIPINHFRRECKLFAYRVGYEDKDGVRTDLPKAEAMNLGDSLPSTGALGGLWTTIGELITGNTALAPVTGKSVPLIHKDGEAKTFFEFVVVGSSFAQVEPAFFANARYADQVALWRPVRDRLNTVTWLRDLVFGLLLEVWGIRDLVVSFQAYDAAAQAWENIDDDVLRTIINRAKTGAMPKALADLVKAAIEPGSALVLRPLQDVAAGVLTSIAARKAVVSEGLFLIGLRSLSSLLLAAPGVVMGAIDLGAVIKDMEDSNQADLWSATMIRPTARLSPSSATLGRGKSLTLTASVPGATPGTGFAYAWSMTGSDLATLAGDGKVGRAFETSTPTVSLGTTPSTLGTLVVSVEIFELAAAGTRSSVGIATSRVEMDDKIVQITPATATIDLVGGSKVFTVSLQPAPTETVSYEWSCASQFGTLTVGGATTSAGQPTITSTLATATYAGRDGLVGGESEVVSCTAFTGVNVLFGSDSATVSIKQKFNVELVSLPAEVPADNNFAVVARITDPVPAGAKVEWNWLHSGVGAITTSLADVDKPNSSVQFDSGASEGLAIFTVSARVTVPGQPAVPVLPVTASTNVKKGLRQVVFEASGGVFGCTDPLACGVSEYTAFVVPRFAKATQYSATLSGYAFAGCNRTVTWNSVVGDGGGCNFPVTYFPHSSVQPTNSWAVWIGFGGPLSGKCVVTVTLSA